MEDTVEEPVCDVVLLCAGEGLVEAVCTAEGVLRVADVDSVGVSVPDVESVALRPAADTDRDGDIDRVEVAAALCVRRDHVTDLVRDRERDTDSDTDDEALRPVHDTSDEGEAEPDVSLVDDAREFVADREAVALRDADADVVVVADDDG